MIIIFMNVKVSDLNGKTSLHSTWTPITASAIMSYVLQQHVVAPQDTMTTTQTFSNLQSRNKKRNFSTSVLFTAHTLTQCFDSLRPLISLLLFFLFYWEIKVCLKRCQVIQCDNKSLKLWNQPFKESFDCWNVAGLERVLTLSWLKCTHKTTHG